jgi:phosphoglucosamine mutase
MEFAKTTFPRGQRLDGLRVVVDCANGAAYRTAPEVLWELGAEVVPVGVSPDGFNINKEVGSTHTSAAVAAVKTHRADLGISLDGDADRVMIIDEKGEVADGDQFMALIADRWAAEGRLAKGTLVATVMSNLGLQRHLEAQGLRLVRTAVGDRYVVEAMREGGYNLGGEQSGHIVMTDHVTTGDGVIAALQFLSAMVETGRKASELARVFPACPQVLTNVRYRKGAAPLDEASVRAAISAGEAKMGSHGRLVIRKSGTEPLVRIMGECDDPDLLQSVVGEIEAEVARFADA